ncbi:hypothetical protein ACH4JZ_18480 [Streptomyces sp. NPDC017615]|uniref:hypothetical protein n=1 Tax=Streptomyces sp. NPDC017615 TaxID=3365003 RepID=UPI00378864AC
MTLDATDWVWKHARSRGNARLAVLAVADKTVGPEATARLGITEARARLGGVGKGVAVKALADAVASGDLIIHEASQGSRAALYLLPGAVNYVRRSGPEYGPQSVTPDRSGIRTSTEYRSASQTSKAPSTGPDSGPAPLDQGDGYWSGFQTGTGPDSGPHHAPIDGMSEGVSGGAPASLTDPIPGFARPLVDQITAAEVYVGWDLTSGEWLRLDAMVKRSGVDMLARHAVTLAAQRQVSSARYFLRAWQNLPPAPTAGTVPAVPVARPTNVIPLDSAAPRKGRAAQSADHLAAALAAMEAQQ